MLGHLPFYFFGKIEIRGDSSHSFRSCLARHSKFATQDVKNYNSKRFCSVRRIVRDWNSLQPLKMVLVRFLPVEHLHSDGTI